MIVRVVSRPNILWICTDQQRYDTLGCYGNEFVETPTLDALAESGVQFERCYSQNPVCTPSRASFLTGRYPRTTRCRQNGQSIPEDETLVTKLLADQGYTCGLAGKLHISPCNPDKGDGNPMMERRIDDGYVDFNWSHDTGKGWTTNEYHRWLRAKGEKYERTPVEGTVHIHTSVPAEHHQTTWCAEQTIDFIETHADADRPWLYSVNPFDPHHPFDPPLEHLERYLDDLDEIPLPNYVEGELDNKPRYQQQDHESGAYGGNAGPPYDELSDREHRLFRAAYWAMVDLIDDQVARILETLDRTNQKEDTIVIFTSDHGEMLGDHGIYLKGPYFYEPAIRVPLIISQPGTIGRKQPETSLIELSDLAPTILDAVGVTQPASIQTESFWSLLTDDGNYNPRESVYSEFYNSMRDHENSELEYLTMVRTDRCKLVKAHRLEEGELYDLKEDPDENINQWDNPEYAEVKMNHLSLMTDRMAETVDPLPEATAPW